MFIGQYLKKLHTQERAVEEVKLAIKPYYQRKDINKEEYKDILRKAVHKVNKFFNSSFNCAYVFVLH